MVATGRRWSRGKIPTYDIMSFFGYSYYYTLLPCILKTSVHPLVFYSYSLTVIEHSPRNFVKPGVLEYSDSALPAGIPYLSHALRYNISDISKVAPPGMTLVAWSGRRPIRV